MGKDSYSLDDILSEVKQRREKRERAEKNNKSPETESKGVTPDETKAVGESKNAEKKETANPQPRINNTSTGPTRVRQTNPASQMTEASNAPKAQPAKKMQDTHRAEPKRKAESAPTQMLKRESADRKAVESLKTNKPKSSGAVDLYSLAQSGDSIVKSDAEAVIDNEKKKNKGGKGTKKSRTVKTVIITLLVLVIAAAVGAGIYIHNALNTITDDGEVPAQVEEWKGMATLTENFPEIFETEASQLSSLQDMIRAWYYNGEPASSSHVLNVLLIGEDTRGSDILEDGTNADSAIIVSINIDTKKITLTSVLRDTYAYWETEPGNEESGQFGKINGSMLSGIGTYINCVEKMYKVDIDNYVIVNFDSFAGIIDALGGVDIELTEAEINEINNPDNGNPNKANRYGGVTIEKNFEGSSGTMHLTGEQALAYCRIRYIDSDTVRADRQKQCLNQMFTQMKDSSTVTLLKVVDKLIPYVKTGFGGSEILSIARFALSEGWLSYDVEMTSVPNARINENGAGGNYYGAWCWKSDFPQDSHYLQTLLYGKSSITLAKERVDILQCNEYGFYEETLVPTWAIIYNNAYGETTTYDFQLIEEETTQSAAGTQ